jgi:DNA topoisomerase-2
LQKWTACERGLQIAGKGAQILHFLEMASTAQVSATYRRCTQVEHIRTRPDSYVGSIFPEQYQAWVMQDGRAVEKEITWVPGLYKIVDEILVNAIDQTKVDPTVDFIKVDIDQEAAVVSISNSSSRGIPIIQHEEYTMYVPELIFGNLLTSSNYDDAEDRIVGGRNGFGAKLTNVFSLCFTVEILDLERGLKYCQSWEDGMATCKPPKITRPKNPKHGYCKITFKPDLAAFSTARLDDDFVSLLHRRAHDAAACTGQGVRVAFNGKNIPCKGGFETYCDLFIGPKKEVPRVFFRSNERWEVCIAAAGDDGFRGISFVNGVWTAQGGTHVEHVVNQLTRRVADALQAKVKGATIRPAHVKERLMVFVNATLVNPTFSSQTKEMCTLKASLFGSVCEIQEEVVGRVVSKLGIADSIIAKAREREAKTLSRTDGAKTGVIRGIPKLEDANKAGGRRSSECTLLVVEGDSARAFAMAGLSVVGRDLYGVFALRGKILNCRDAPIKSIAENKEIASLKQILGLREGHKYRSLSELRYGRVMLLTDADCDGTHIRALFINFVEFGWPELIEVSTASWKRTPIILSEASCICCGVCIATSCQTLIVFGAAGLCMAPEDARGQGLQEQLYSGLLHGAAIQGVGRIGRGSRPLAHQVPERCVA